MSWRTEQIVNKMNVSKHDAVKLISEKIKQRENFIKEDLEFDVFDPHNYQIVINDAEHSVEQTAKIIIESMKIKELLK